MEALTIAYDFSFRLTIRKRNGRTYKNHHIIGSGAAYSEALWDVYFKLRKKHAEILAVQEAKPLRIAFAFENGKFVTLNLSDHPTTIPQDLNKDLNQLQKTATL
jgi:hypothetical protein